MTPPSIRLPRPLAAVLCLLSTFLVIPAATPATAGLANGQALLDRIVAIVDDDIVTARELEDELRRVRRQIESKRISPPSDSSLRRQVVEELVLTRIQLQLAKRNGIEVDDATLDRAIANIAEINGVSEERFRALLREDGYDYAAFREQMRTEIIKQRLRQQVIDSRILISDSQIDRFLADQRRQGKTGNEYHVAHILISIPEAASPDEIARARRRAEAIRDELVAGADFDRLAVARSDAGDRLEGGDLGWRKIGELPTLFANEVVDMQPGRIGPLLRSSRGFHIIKLIEVRNVAPHMTTQTHARHILVRSDALNDDALVRERLESIRRRILAGEDFAELARTHSADKATAGHGGDLGWIEPGSMVPEFEKAMAKLAPGEISPPVRSQYGWHLIQVLERREHDATSEFNRNQARQQLRKRESDAAYSNWLRQIRSEAYVVIRLEEDADP